MVGDEAQAAPIQSEERRVVRPTETRRAGHDGIEEPVLAAGDDV